ncbi:nucleotidyltransferase domain-containing protein [Flavisphingomonas formosensis]|uniref:nucleotidyltransferase domain-containing protein n=1 Tax=Flavisphingomonas formosensis TaxID=861534 RepID=UPI0012FC69BF|nr:nucleotidyltransferase domain-containing protein [Sphingomonas formosensis]
MTTNLQHTIDPAVQREIEARLATIEAKHGIRILMAVESGSRAWGFPSPDSDYDVRFLYVRPRDWYLSLEPGRDVIEMPIEDEIDLNGWDVRKALGLLLKSNAIVGEWIGSPIRYREDDPIVTALTVLADEIHNPRAIAHHYARLGRNAVERWPEDGSPVPVKRYFYALRPALAIRSLRFDPMARPPMNLQQLVSASYLSGEIASAIEALVDAKRSSNELSNTTRLPVLDELVLDELARADELPIGQSSDRPAAQANDLFLRLVNT